MLSALDITGFLCTCKPLGSTYPLLHLLHHLHIVFLHTKSFITTGYAPDTGMDIGVAYIYDFTGMALYRTIEIHIAIFAFRITLVYVWLQRRLHEVDRFSAIL